MYTKMLTQFIIDLSVHVVHTAYISSGYTNCIFGVATVIFTAKSQFFLGILQIFAKSHEFIQLQVSEYRAGACA